ncbi:hypothetical protein N9D38_07765 [Rubripirellula sp.]|nr:hypothetical protein [Rubripirellula sp.]
MSLICFAALFSASLANAHPGHGEPGSKHYFSEPAHAIPLLILGVILTFLVSGLYKTKVANPRVKA